MAELLIDADSAVAAAEAPPHPFAEFWRSFRRNRGALVGLTVIVLISLVAIFADLIAPHFPDRQFTREGSDVLLNLVPPAWVEGQTEQTTVTIGVIGNPRGAIVRELALQGDRDAVRRVACRRALDALGEVLTREVPGLG